MWENTPCHEHLVGLIMNSHVLPFSFLRVFLGKGVRINIYRTGSAGTAWWLPAQRIIVKKKTRKKGLKYKSLLMILCKNFCFFFSTFPALSDGHHSLGISVVRFFFMILIHTEELKEKSDIDRHLFFPNFFFFLFFVYVSSSSGSASTDHT